jgi:molecular chaperone GrpE
MTEPAAEEGRSSDGADIASTDMDAEPSSRSEETQPTFGASRAAQLEGDFADLQDRHLRLAAEFDNYRKRIDRERQSVAESAAADLLAELLPLVDDLDRALKADAGAEGAEAYRRGVELIHRQLLELLRKRGVRPIEALGTDFDPNYHQAVAHEAAPGRRDGEVIEEFRRGYMLGDRLLRPAMVKVAKG